METPAKLFPGEYFLMVRGVMRVCWVCKIAIRDRWAIEREHSKVPGSTIARHTYCTPPEQKEE